MDRLIKTARDPFWTPMPKRPTTRYINDKYGRKNDHPEWLAWREELSNKIWTLCDRFGIPVDHDVPQWSLLAQKMVLALVGEEGRGRKHSRYTAEGLDAARHVYVLVSQVQERRRADKLPKLAVLKICRDLIDDKRTSLPAFYQKARTLSPRLLKDAYEDIKRAKESSAAENADLSSLFPVPRRPATMPALPTLMPRQVPTAPLQDLPKNKST